MSGPLLSTQVMRIARLNAPSLGARALPDALALLLGAASGSAPLPNASPSALSRALGLPAAALTIAEAVRDAPPGVALRAYAAVARRAGGGGGGAKALVSALGPLARLTAPLGEVESRRAARFLAPHVARVVARGEPHEARAAGIGFLKLLNAFSWGGASTSAVAGASAASRSAARLSLAHDVLAGTREAGDALVWLPERAALAAKLNSPAAADAAILAARLVGGGDSVQSYALRAARRAIAAGRFPAR